MRNNNLRCFLSNQEESRKVISELDLEIELLRSTLEKKGVELRDIIQEEKQRKEAELQVETKTIQLFY